MAEILIASGICLAAWFTIRRSMASVALPMGVREPPQTATHSADASQIQITSGRVTLRLWNLAFAAPVEPEAVGPEHARIRNAVSQLLRAETLDPKYFPRRPSLMPQLLQAVDDPQVATDRLSRIIAHDPVLAADVLRLANSSLYRASPAPIETIQRAIVVLGVEALRGLIATAMLQPVFRATRSNFPRFPRMLWERTARAARAAELYTLSKRPQDRFEAQLVILLSALGPLVVYAAAIEVYSKNPRIAPSPGLCVALTLALGPRMSLRVARHWDVPPRLVNAIERSSSETLTHALMVGELLGTLSLLQTQSVISSAEGLEAARDAGLADELAASIWHQLTVGS